ncbi:type I toxin-antitoxin system Fst family toxin [Streptococcus suis]
MPMCDFLLTNIVAPILVGIILIAIEKRLDKDDK